MNAKENQNWRKIGLPIIGFLGVLFGIPQGISLLLQIIEEGFI